jgi:pantothenate kinase
MSYEISQVTEELKSFLNNQAGRIMVGLAGEPGSGKSTFLSNLVSELPQGVAVVVPMDGFHLSNSILIERGLRHRKGSIETFDAQGYVNLLKRIREQKTFPIYAPTFSREIEEAVASSIEILPSHRIVLTEGNYILSPEKPWDQLVDIFDKTYFIELEQHTRLERLASRHKQYGRSEEEAKDWIASNDELNARLIRTTKKRADHVIYFQ